METVIEIEKQNICNQFRVLLHHNKNSFLMRRAFRNLLEHCEDKNIDYLPLLKAAINEEPFPTLHGIKLPEARMASEEQPSKIPHQCKICQKVFEKGENGWKGYQRVCEQMCNINDLIPCKL